MWQLVLYCAAWMGVSFGSAPPRPTLVEDFSSDYTMIDAKTGKKMQSEKVAISNTKMEIAMTANYTVPFGKIIKQVLDCKNSVMLLAEPFFDSEVCYKEPQETGSPQQCFEMYAGSLLSSQEYARTNYSGSGTVNGKSVSMWSYATSSTHKEQIHENGKVYNATVTMKMSMVYYVTSAGNLLKRSLTEEEDITGIPNPVHSKYSYDYVFENYVSPANPSSFSPPSGVTCLPTDKKKGGVGAKHMMGWMMGRFDGPSRLGGAKGAVMMNNVDVIKSINSQKLGWTAAETSLLAGKRLADAKKLMGTIPSVVLDGLGESDTPARRVGAPVPTSFDARQKWGKMCASIGTIRNQGNCGSCWAFGATESLEDRLCISSGGKKVETLSAEYLTDCDPTDEGCGGGFLDNAWRYLVKQGLPTEACDPYTHCPYPPFPNCTKPNFNEFGLGVFDLGVCPTKCKDGSAPTFVKPMNAYAVAKPGDVEAIQNEVMTNGPIEVAFFVYSDFMNYQSGVYVRSKNAQGPLGGHAVKIVGWGHDAPSGLDYWLVANSWSPNWGDKGFFKIVRGRNECGIETTPAAGKV